MDLLDAVSVLVDRRLSGAPVVDLLEAAEDGARLSTRSKARRRAE
jgi:hypothetical protein